MVFPVFLTHLLWTPRLKSMNCFLRSHFLFNQIIPIQRTWTAPSWTPCCHLGIMTWRECSTRKWCDIVHHWLDGEMWLYMAEDWREDWNNTHGLMAIVLRFVKLVSNLDKCAIDFAKVQMYLSFCVQFAYTPMTIMFRGGPLWIPSF